MGKPLSSESFKPTALVGAIRGMFGPDKGRGRKSPARKRQALNLEALEPRLLLAADLPFQLSDFPADPQDITVRASGASIQIVDSGTLSVLATALLADTSAVRIAGSNLANQIKIDLSTAFAVPVFIDDATAADADELWIVGPSAMTWNIDGLDEGHADAGGGVTFLGIENLRGDDANRDTFVIEDGGLLVGGINAGAGGNDSVFMASPSAVVVTDAQITTQAGAVVFDIAGFESAVFEAPSLSEGVGGFAGQTLLTTGLADWVSQGPGTLNNGQVRLPPDNFVAGAIHDIAIHPFDLSSLYIATVGGGIWRNSDISVLFEFSESSLADLTPAATARLSAFADFLAANPTLNVQIVGHTDDVGDLGPNQTLSETRANTVRQFLINSGISGSRLTASGQGETAPIDTNGTDAGRERNRRVELIVNHWQPLTDDFPTLSTGALAISPRDADGNLVTASTPSAKLVLYAGTGSMSSGGTMFNKLGANTAIGMLKSSDGGSTWAVQDQLSGGKINAIQVLPGAAPDGTLIVASDLGLFVSTDGGASYTNVASARGSDNVSNDGDLDIDEDDERIFNRFVGDLVKDPGNPLRVYAAVPNVGVFVTNDGGATWSPLNNGALTNVANASRIVLATSPKPDGANHPLYVALLGNTEQLTGGSAVNTLTLTVSENTVFNGGYSTVAAGDRLQIWGSGFDGVDNDADGLIDAADLKERPAMATDGIDNDADGLIDAADPVESGIFSFTMRVASVSAAVGGNRTVTLVPVISDGIDNDSDGTVDQPGEGGAGGLQAAWGAGATIRVIGGGGQRLASLLRSDDLGTTWSTINIPGTQDATGGFHGIHPGGQGRNHFSMVVDPQNPDVIYVGGDRQPLTANNQFNATDFTGRLFRFDPTNNDWDVLTDDGAGGTAPHADSRNAVFRGLHMVEVDDGGIYELRNAANPAPTWQSLNHDLTLAEFYSVAYDPLNDLILGGTQDIGDGLQTATDSLAWTSVGSGDGATVGFNLGNPVFSSQNLGSFTVARAGLLVPTLAGATVLFLPAGTDVQANDLIDIDVDFPGVQTVAVSTAADVGVTLGSVKVTLKTALTNALAAGTIAGIRPPNIANRISDERFTTPWVMNDVVPNAMLIGTNSAIESPDVGRTLTVLGTTTGSGATDIGQVRSLVYGGKEGVVAKPTVIWIGTNPAASKPDPADKHFLWLRDAASAVGDPLAPVTSFTTEIGKAVKDIAIDPTDWHRVWVLDAEGHIWFSPNAGQTKVFNADGGAGGTNVWKDVSAGLSNLPGAALLQQLATERQAGTDVLLVGGQGGVFRKIGDGPWHEYGVGLPNALNTVISRVGGTDDLLLVGTFGRGAWTMDDASLTLATPTVLTINGSDGDDEIVLRRNGDAPWLLDVFLFADGQTEPTLPTYSVPFANLTGITIDVSGLGDDDVLIDGDFGSVVSTNASVQVTGGSGTDRLTMTSTAESANVIFVGDVVGVPNAGSQGSVLIDGLGQDAGQKVTWTGLNQVNDLIAAVPTVEGVATGLDMLADALGRGLADALDGTTLPGIDAHSLARALNGVIIDSLRPKEDAFVSAAQVPGSAVIQADGGGSLLLRLLEAGGLDIAAFLSGAITDTAALEAALEALDGTADNVSLTINPPGGDATIADDLLYDVHASGLVLKGVVDLATLGTLELTGLLDVSLTLDLSLAFGFDSKGFFIKTTGPTLPSFTITNLVVSGEAVGGGTLGFLGVDMSAATLSMDPDVLLRFTLGDPATVDDNLIRADELLAPPNPDQLIDFIAISDGDANPDLVLNATLDVAAIVPGIDSSISLATTDLKLTWANITNPLSVSLAAGVTPGADAAEFLRFLEFNIDDILSRLTTLKDNLEGLYGAEIPYLSDSITQIVNFVNAFQAKVLDPLTGGAGFEVPSIQALVRNLATSLGLTPEQLGLGYDKVSKELTYRLLLSQELLNASKTLGAGLDTSGGLADLTFSTTATVSATVTLDAILGMDLDLIGGDPLDWFFLKDASITADVKVLADDIEARARFGFLSIGIDEGTLRNADGSGPATLAVTATLVDPTSGLPGRVDLRDILDNLDEVGKLIDIDGSGSVRLVLPIESSFLPGLPNIPDGGPVDPDKTITVTITDIGDPDSYNVVLGSGLTELGNFRNIDAAGIVGILAQLTGWLDQFRQSDTFAAFDIPFIGPALDNVLGVADAFRDKLLYDDADDGNDATTTLLFDLNAALGASSLAGQLRAEKDSLTGHLKLVANDASISGITVSAGLGFTGAEASADGIFESIIATNAPALLAPGVDVTLQIALSGAPAVAVLLKKTDTDNNLKLGNDRAKLSDAANSPTFATADEMVLKLAEALGAPNLLQYNATDDTLSFSLNLAETFGQIDLPLDFSLDNLPDFLTLETNGTVRLKAEGAFNFTLGVYLGDAPSSKSLDDADLLADVNGGVVTDVALTALGAADVRTVYGRLTADASFGLTVQNAGSHTGTVTLAKSLTDANVTVTELVADLNLAINTAGLAAYVQAAATGQTLELRAIGGTTAIDLTAALTNPAVRELGFAGTATAVDVGGTLKIEAENALAPLRGRLDSTATFNVSIGGAAAIPVTVEQAATATNRFLFDIEADVQAAINAVPALNGLLEVNLSGGRLAFVTKGAAANAASLVVTATAGNSAVTQLGLGTSNTGNRDNFIVQLRDGSRHGVSLFGLTTLGQAKAAMDAVPNLAVSYNTAGTALVLQDASNGGNSFKVELTNQNTAAITLGILREDAQEGEAPDGKIEGLSIGELTALDRLYIENTNASINLTLSTPQLNGAGQVFDTDFDGATDDGVSGTAKFGFVGIGVDGGGTVTANLGLALTDPGTTQLDGRISFRELGDGLTGDLLAFLNPTFTGGGTLALDIELTPALPGLDLGADPRIALEVVSLGNPFTGAAPVINFTYPDIGDLLSFDNLDLDFASIVEGLRALADFLGEFETFSFLGEPLPLIDLSISDLIDVADKFASAVDEAQANPSGTVQLLEDKLKEAFGIPQASNLIDLSLYTDDFNTPADFSDDQNILRIKLTLEAGFNESLSLDLDLGELLNLPDVANLAGSANLAASGGVNLTLDFGFDVASPLDIYVFNTTGASANITASGTDLTFKAALGPFGLFVKDGNASITASAVLGVEQAYFDAAAVSALAEPNRAPLGALLGDLGSAFEFTPSGSATATLPVYFPTESLHAGDITLLWTDLFDFDTLTLNVPDDLLNLDPGDFSILDQLLLGVDGVDLFLEGLQDILDGEIGGITLPLIGDKLAGAADVIGDFRSGFVEDFRQAVADLANPVSAFNAGGINGPGVPGAVDPISKILFDLLGPTGLDLLLDSDDAGTGVSAADIKFVSNVSTPGVLPADVFLDWDFKLGSTLVNAGTGIGFDIGIPGLGLETTGSINLEIGWELALGFGLNSADGFYIDIADGSELQLDVDVTVPGGGIAGTLGFLQFTAVDDTTDGDNLATHLGATFGVNIFNRNNTGDTKLGFNELGKVGVSVGIAAEAVVDLGMKLSMSSDLVPGAASNFPSLVADFTLQWGLGDRQAGTLVSLGELDGSFLKNGLQYVGFSNIGLDVGSYFSDLIGPIVAKVQEITEPIKPFLDFLTEPIPVISDLAGPTSLLDIAAMSGFVNPGIITAIEVIDQVVDIASQMSGIGDNVVLYFDSFLPEGALELFDASEPAYGGLDFSNFNPAQLEGLATDLLGDLLPGDLAGAIGGLVGGAAEALNKMRPGGGVDAGFKLDIIENPSQIFGMLMGKDADLVSFTMEALTVGADFSAFFSLLGPLGVSINAEFDAQFGPFRFGYDTLGVRSFANSDFRNPLLLFDGFFVDDMGLLPGTEGTDVPELQFNAGLWAAAELNLAIARGGVGGGLFADIDFDLHDPDDDGKVRIKELVTNVLNEFKYGSPALSPLAIFDITGKLTAELFAFVKVDLFLFSIDERWHITDPITLLDFESDFVRVPTLATELPGGVLQLNMGKFSEARIEGNLSDFGEKFVVTQGSDASHVNVWSPLVDFNDNNLNDNDEAQEYFVNKAILALGGEGDDIIDLSGVTANLSYELEGNAGDDIIKAGSGAATPVSKITGGQGNDELWGSGGADNLFGETGEDEIHGGGGADWLFGDGSAKDLIVGNVITVNVKASDGDDELYGDAGDDLLIGAGGADKGEGGDQNDVLIGDAGTVTVNARAATDIKDTMRGSTGFKDNLKGDAGDDRIWGGKGDDKIWGGADADQLFGEKGFDTVNGDDGADLIYGGDDNDLLHGDAGADTVYGEAGSDTINGGSEADWLYGGTGADLMHGDGGDDFLFGNAEPDQLFGDAGNDYLEGGGGNDIAFGDIGQDTLVAGYGSDTLDGEGGSDVYRITARGGSTTELSTAYDSGANNDGTDVLTLLGTPAADTVLLRAMADSYFPLLERLELRIETVFESGEADKLAAMKQAIIDAYGPHKVPSGMLADLTDVYFDGKLPALHQAVQDKESDPTRRQEVKDLVAGIYNAAPNVILLGGKLVATLREVREYYEDLDLEVPDGLLDALGDVYRELTASLGDLKGAIGPKYELELDALGADTDTAFMALINNGGLFVERFNYRYMEGLNVNTLDGDDYLVSDDVLAATTINLGLGDDRVQVGQVFRSPRVGDTFDSEGNEVLVTHITAEDVFATLEITRGWLSNGVSVPTTINGGEGDDNFTVFRNVAVLNLNGGDGDDVFTVRAFALKGSTDSERARTDMKGDAGADTILYVVNAPVGIDGGDGFDTVRIIGTEFSDDFVVTDSGIFGAGLNVTYVNIEKLVADGAEGDDRYFVLSTGLEVVTEIDGGLGSDSFFVGGNPSRSPISVVSNDLRGHSGIILHSVESTSSVWDDIPVEGLSANVGDAQESMLIVNEEGGRSSVFEAAVLGAGLAFDTYTVRPTRSPAAGKTVLVNVVPAGMSPEDEAKAYADLEFWNAATNSWVNYKDLPALAFTAFNWQTAQEVKFRAVDDAASEGRRITFINHTLLNSDDLAFREAQMLSVKVFMDDDDRDGVVVRPTGLDNVALEGGFTDAFTVMLTQAPSADVTVAMSIFGGDISLSQSSLTFTTLDWATPQTVTVTAVNDSVIEGFHTDYVSFTITSADVDTHPTVSPDPVWVDGDFDLPGVQDIPVDKATSYLLLPNRPDVGPGAGPVTVLVGTGVDQVALDAARFSVSGNTLNFLSEAGTPELRSGHVEVSYSYLEPGYDGTDVRDIVVDLYDNDTPMVIIRQSDGSTDTIENGLSDSYDVRLSMPVAPGETVTVTADAFQTRSSYGRTTYFNEQVTVNGLSITSLVFDENNWNVDQTVTVEAKFDDYRDGNDTQVFAPDLQTVNKIRGPLIIDGAAGDGSLTLPLPLMMPWEVNLRESSGNVVAFTAGSGGGADEFMTVEQDDLDAVVTKLGETDPEISTIQDLVGKTVEMTRGKGIGVVLDPTRPRDLFDRFWLITEVTSLGGGNVQLTLKNPTAVDPDVLGSSGRPDSASEYAITGLSINFFADEREQVDYLFVYDEDSVADDVGALTSSDGAVLGFAGNQMTVETSALQRTLELLELTDMSQLQNRVIEITVGPGLGRSWTIAAVADGPTGETKLLTLTPVEGSGTPTNRSEFRIEGADRFGRITGFGMGPNILFSGKPQGGGITYGDIEVVQMSLGRGDDAVRVDYATHSDDHATERSGVFHTLLLLDTGVGDDTVTVKLTEGQDGQFALTAGTGDDTVLDAGSTLGMVVFGGEGQDDITTGGGNDIVFGDIGRVDYVNDDGEIITRLGHTQARLLINPLVEGASNLPGGVTTLTDSDANFATDHGGLAGLMMQAISMEGHVQFRRIVANTADTLFLDQPWDEVPTGNGIPDQSFAYRISVYPEDQTDGLLRGPRLLWSIEELLGDKDVIHTGGGSDIAIGGAGDDEIYGGAGVDRIAGDDARFDFAPVNGEDGPTQLLRITAPTVTVMPVVAGNDHIEGGEGDDLLLGSFGADTVFGDAGNDLIVGDAAVVDFAPGNLLLRLETVFGNHVANGSDTLSGNADDDLLIGGGLADWMDGNEQDDLLFGDNVTLVLNPGSGDAIQPRFSTLTGTAIYGADGQPQLGSRMNRPGGNPAWADWTITLDQSLDSTRFGDDFIAGGAHDDQIFGQRGNDTIQGDGSLVDLQNSGASVGAANDGDDYVEGNAGSDLIFGNLGQDDLIGGSSTVFSLNDRDLRDDGSDTIYGGAGTELARNHLGDGSHGRDADMILGDNGRIVRLVNSGGYLGFNYDNAYAGDVAIVVRAAKLEDYTPGNTDRVPTLARADDGAGDLIHGESGDDAVYGMSGNDVLFGEGQDDDLIGGWGLDWISGGTGSDGVLGDDGRLLTSRNGLTEALSAVNTATVQQEISTPGKVQIALINPTGTLLKTADLTPFNVAPTDLDMLFRPQKADDILFGGLGNDFMHGGSGDDAMSGAEALAAVYAAPANAGNVLRYGELRAGEFALYNEYEPMRRIDGFLLNFDPREGALVDARSTGTADDIFSDGDDKLFGDLGNDWIVGGTGRDNAYGGWGDDLLNADDDQGAGSYANTSPETHTSYEDRVYGGAGRDVLIGNTGGDRLIDWVGEFNSYLVPFAPFGNATVSRTLQPQLAEFLYALSKADGADPTLGTPGDPRNGEPYAELGVIRQQDPVWQAQTGAPADPQAGNVPGGPRDVLRSASFNDGALQALAADSGKWQVSGGALQVASNSNKSDAVAVYQVGDALPSYYEVLATVKVIKPTAGWNANSYVIFDYQSPTSFKFVGLNVATNKLEMGARTAAGWQVLKQAAFTGSIKSDTWYSLQLMVNGLTATLVVDNRAVFSHAFAPTVVDGYSYGLNWGLVGFGSNKSRGALDNIAVQVVPPAASVTRSEDFSAGAGALLAGAPNASTGSWVTGSGRLQGTPATAANAAVQLLNLSGVTSLKTTSLLELSTVLNTSGRAGLVFDRYSDTDFKFAAIDVASKQVLIGHRTAAGWFIDAAVTRNTLAVGVDAKLGLVIRGSSVSVTLNDQATLGFVFNAVGVDGRFGLFAQGVAGSFDSVTVKTNDPAVPATLMAADSTVTVQPVAANHRGTVEATLAAPSAEQLKVLAAEAMRRWSRVEDASHLRALGMLSFDVADLPGGQLAQWQGDRITVDVDAAGLGWFIDASPGDDAEFRRSGNFLTARAAGPAEGRVDLLSVLTHEMGHAIGLGHADKGVMAEELLAGQRVVPAPARAGAAPEAFNEPQRGMEAPGIDWTPVPRQPAGILRTQAAVALPAPWQESFVTRLGVSTELRGPNANMRLVLPLAHKLNSIA